MSEPYEYTSFEACFVIPAQSGLPKSFKAKPELVRVCAECGHVFFFVGPKALERIRSVVKE